MKLTPAQLDRACGALLGTAIGDALGAGYEFGSAPLGPDGPQMIGGGLGGFAPGEWTDDTSMMWCIADVFAVSHYDVLDPLWLDNIARGFRLWFESGPSDIGIHTRAVLRSSGLRPNAAWMRRQAELEIARSGRGAGNGSLMRTAPVALPFLDSAHSVAMAASMVSSLTHEEGDASDACVLWSLAIRHAILRGEFDLRSGLTRLDYHAAVRFNGLIDAAEANEPSSFSPNGWVVTAFQAAWSAIVHTPVPEDDARRHFEDVLATAIAIGDDTDTVAAIAGALVGARWGASAMPARWRRISHGYPNFTGDRLCEYATLAANQGEPIAYGWPMTTRVDYSMWPLKGTYVRHPHDDGVVLGDALVLDDLPEEITAVVSLCLVGDQQRLREHVEFRLIDSADDEVNPNLDFILVDAAQTIADLRAEGHTVFVHCVAAQSRTPAVAIAYALRLGIQLDNATRDICSALPGARPNAAFLRALARIAS